MCKDAKIPCRDFSRQGIAFSYEYLDNHFGGLINPQSADMRNRSLCFFHTRISQQHSCPPIKRMICFCKFKFFDFPTA